MDSDLEENIRIKLIQSGEKDKLKELLRDRLKECGWENAMKSHCRKFVKDKVLNQLRLDDLIKDITPKGRESIPDKLKIELLDKIKSIVEANAV